MWCWGWLQDDPVREALAVAGGLVSGPLGSSWLKWMCVMALATCMPVGIDNMDETASYQSVPGVLNGALAVQCVPWHGCQNRLIPSRAAAGPKLALPVGPESALGPGGPGCTQTLLANATRMLA